MNEEFAKKARDTLYSLLWALGCNSYRCDVEAEKLYLKALEKSGERREEVCDGYGD